MQLMVDALVGALIVLFFSSSSFPLLRGVVGQSSGSWSGDLEGDANETSLCLGNDDHSTDVNCSTTNQMPIAAAATTFASNVSICCQDIVGRCAGNTRQPNFNCSASGQVLVNNASITVGNSTVACCQDITGFCAGNTAGISADFPCNSTGRVLKRGARAIVSTGLARDCCDLMPCSAPGVVITTEAPLITRPSASVSVTAVGALPLCAVPSGAILQWEWSISDPAVVLDPQTRSTSQLQLLPFTLLAGASASLSVRVALSSNPNETATASIQMLVLRTPEVFAVISGGSYRRIYRGDSVVLDGSMSSDPDTPEVDWDTIQWSCVDVTIVGADTTCFGENNGGLTDGMMFRVDTAQLSSSTEMVEIALVVAANGRTDRAVVTVEIVAAPVPEVSILAVQPKYSASQRISLVGVGQPVDADRSDFTWGWSANLLADTGVSQRIGLDAISTTSSTNQVLVITPGSLSAGASYRFRLEVNDGRATGLAQVDLHLNLPPADGALSVVPIRGTAITGNFVITASGWSDEDLPLTYAFAYIERPTSSGSIENALSEAVNSMSISVVLPAGTFWLQVVVSDSFGASTVARTEVEATTYQPAPHSDITTDAEEMISVSVTNGNAEQAAQLVSAFANALSDQNTGQTEPGESEAQLASAQQARSVLASGLSTIATSAQTFSSGKLRLVAQATSAVASEPEQVSPAALEGTVNALSHLGSANAMGGKVQAPE
eukprot:COSAG02_NODE_7736_length_2868_cov_3.812268_1_plen_721_part_10